MQRDKTHHRLPLALVCLFVALLYLSYGCEGILRRDDANLMVAGQGVARGIPPYHSIFNMTGPVPPLVAGSGCLLSRALGTDDLATTRVLFGALSLLAVLLLYGLARRMGLSVLAAAAGAWVLAAYPEFARCALNGPQKKTVMVLFVAAALLAMDRKRWSLAGAASVLAGLSWQGAFGVAIACLAGACAAGFRPAMRLAAGAAAATLGTFTYYACTGSFMEMIDGTFGMVLYHPLNSHEAPSRFLRIFRILPPWQATVYAMGGLALAATAACTLRHTRPLRQALADIRTVAALGMVLVLGVSLADFQGTPDFFVLLPFLGLGWAVAVERAARVAPRPTLLLTTMIAAATLLHAAATRDGGLPLQRRHAEAVLARFGDQAKVRVVGVPEWLVLTHRTQDDPFVFIIGGIDDYVDARHPGGFSGWLQKLKDESPDIIMSGPTHGARMAPYFEWLNQAYEPHKLGAWTAYAKKAGGDAQVR